MNRINMSSHEHDLSVAALVTAAHGRLAYAHLQPPAVVAAALWFLSRVSPVFETKSTSTAIFLYPFQEIRVSFEMPICER